MFVIITRGRPANAASTAPAPALTCTVMRCARTPVAELHAVLHTRILLHNWDTSVQHHCTAQRTQKGILHNNVAACAAGKEAKYY